MEKGIIGVLLATFTLSACHEKGDIYDPNYNPDFGVSVPDDFDWSTTKTLTVNVEVDDEHDGKYLYFVRVYIVNPKDGGLPIASDKSNMDLPFSEEIVIPVSVKKLYVEQCFMKANATEIIRIQEVAIDDVVVNYSFRGIAKSMKSSKIAGRDSDDKKKIVVKEGDTFVVNASPWKDYEVKVKKGGTLRFEGNVQLHNCKIENEGSLIADGNLILKKSELDNERSVHVTGNLEVDGESELDMEEASCTVVEGKVTLKSDAEMEDAAYFSCTDLDLLTKGADISMETGAWIRVIRQLTASADCKIYYDDDDDNENDDEEDDYIQNTKWAALVQIGMIKNNGNGNLKVNKKILVECKDPGKADIDKESLVDDASKYIQIIPTACNDGGINIDTPSYLAADYTFALEDQYPEKGDYDMNDIVVFISKESCYSPIRKQATIKGELIAAGANMTIIPYVGVKKENRSGSKPLFTDVSGNALDVYKAFGGNGATCPVNTHAEGGVKLSTVPFTVELDNVKDKLNINTLDFYIRVNGHEIDCDTRNKGNDIFGIVIPGKFRYPEEGYNISDCYGEVFKKWIESNKNQCIDWYTSEKAKDVISF